MSDSEKYFGQLVAAYKTGGVAKFVDLMDDLSDGQIWSALLYAVSEEAHASLVESLDELGGEHFAKGGSK